MVVFTSLYVIKCSPVIKLQVKCTLLIHKVVCMVQPNQFNQEICTVIKSWVTEAEAWLCFPGLVSQHQSRLQKISPFMWPLVVCWLWPELLPGAVAILRSVCSRVTFREACRAAFLQLVILASVLDFFMMQHLWYQCCFETQQHDALLWPFRIRLLEKHS